MKRVIALAAALVSSSALAQDGARLSQECRREVVQLCGTNRGEIRNCLREKAKDLPETCRSELRERFRNRAKQPAAS